MTISFEPALRLAGTPTVIVRSVDDATRVLREYTGSRTATRDSILRRLTAASSEQEAGEAAKLFCWWAEQEGLLAPTEIDLPASSRVNRNAQSQLEESS